MQISDLLHRASQLAPEWCELQDEVATWAYWRVGDFSVKVRGGDPGEVSALILYAVLRECERRGLRFGVSCTDGAWSGYIFPEPPQDPMEPWVAIYKNDSDPATAALSAFVALLEAEQEVKV